MAEDAIAAAVNNPVMVPNHVSIANMQTDMKLFDQLDRISLMVSQLSERIEDTKMIVGSEAYQSALNLYKAFGTAADAGAPGADTIHNQLKKRFSGRGNTAKEASIPPVS